MATACNRKAAVTAESRGYRSYVHIISFLSFRRLNPEFTNYKIRGNGESTLILTNAHKGGCFINCCLGAQTVKDIYHFRQPKA